MNENAKIQIAGETYTVEMTGSEQVPGSTEWTCGWVVTRPNGETYGTFAKTLNAAVASVREVWG